MQRSGRVPLSTGCSYDWAQSFEEVLVEVKVPPHTQSKHIMCRIGGNNLTLHVLGATVIEGLLFGDIDIQESDWQLGELCRL